MLEFVYCCLKIPYYNLIAGMVVSVVDPQPGERIIDCCAAPGGKTLYMASQLSGQGILWKIASLKLKFKFSDNLIFLAILIVDNFIICCCKKIVKIVF